MAPFYAEMCDELGQSVDKKLLSDLKQKNKDKIAELDKKIADAEELEGSFPSQKYYREMPYLVKIRLKIVKLCQISVIFELFFFDEK